MSLSRPIAATASQRNEVVVRRARKAPIASPPPVGPSASAAAAAECREDGSTWQSATEQFYLAPTACTPGQVSRHNTPSTKRPQIKTPGLAACSQEQ